MGLCPFHDDEDPSFAVWVYNDREFCGCWACGFGPTDAIGFIRKLHGVDFKSSLVIIRRHARAMPEGWKSTALPSTTVRDGARSFKSEADKSLTDDPSAAREFLERRGLGELDEWLMERYRFGGDSKYVVVPHYTPSGQHVTALKYRELDGQLLTMKDGTLAFLYGCWLDEHQPFVVLAEGESDCWRLAAYFRDDPRVLVMGLPSGAKGPKIQWLRVLEGRRLLLFFDGDEAGRKAAAEWKAERPDAVNIDPGDGMDACKLTDERIRDLLTRGL